MNKAEIEGVLNRALDAFVKCDQHLLAADASERSMSHQIAVHLAKEIPGYDIDCEYNRDGFDVKRLHFKKASCLRRRRGSDRFPRHHCSSSRYKHGQSPCRRNEKAAAIGGICYDHAKLKAFRSELKYRWAVCLVIGQDQYGVLQRKVEWIEG